jgi:hypothetical protein
MGPFSQQTFLLNLSKVVFDTVLVCLASIGLKCTPSGCSAWRWPR